LRLYERYGGGEKIGGIAEGKCWADFLSLAGGGLRLPDSLDL